MDNIKKLKDIILELLLTLEVFTFCSLVCLIKQSIHKYFPPNSP